MSLWQIQGWVVPQQEEFRLQGKLGASESSLSHLVLQEALHLRETPAGEGGVGEGGGGLTRI